MHYNAGDCGPSQGNQGKYKFQPKPHYIMQTRNNCSKGSQRKQTISQCTQRLEQRSVLTQTHPLFPRSLVFKATIKPPIQNMIKTLMKSSILSLEDTKDNVTEKKRQIIKGPQRSQCLSSLVACSLWRGRSKITYLILYQTDLRSLIYVKIQIPQFALQVNLSQFVKLQLLLSSRRCLLQLIAYFRSQA